MTTNWSEKLEASVLDGGVSAGVRVVSIETALAILREARRAAFKEAGDVAYRAVLSRSDDTSLAVWTGDDVRALAAKEGET